MSKGFKRYQTENGNKYIRYYTPEGENSEFAKHNGATRRAIESRASLVAAAKIGSSYGADSENFQAWLKDPAACPDISTRIRLEFVKECERLAILSEKELDNLRQEDSRYTGIINTKSRNAHYKADIYEMAQRKQSQR